MHSGKTMKTILALIFCLGLGLAQVVHAEDTTQQRAKKKARKPTPAPQRAMEHAAKPGRSAQQNAAAAQMQRSNTSRQLNTNMRTAPAPPQVNRSRTAVVPENQKTRVTTQNNVVVRNRTSFAEAVRLHPREFHGRDWWIRHHTRFIFVVNTGWFFWDTGFWYPAWGYDPAYNSYAYDGPIYGYNDLPPNQIITNVQIALQQQGYYHGAVDGVLGPMTRAALANYQRDHGLAITSAIDAPTIGSLGLA